MDSDMNFFLDLLMNLAASFLASVAFSVLFSVPRHQYLFCGLTGACGYIVYDLLHMKISTALAIFFATLVIALLSRLLAIVRKCPVTVLLIPGIIPLAPGAGIYYTAYNIMQNDSDAAANYAYETLTIALAIVLGIIVVFALPIKRRAFNFRLGSPNAS